MASVTVLEETAYLLNGFQHPIRIPNKGVVRIVKKIKQFRTRQERPQPAFQLLPVKPMTDNQASAFKSYKSGKNLLLHGYAGTGKTFIALGLALQETDKNVVIVRSAVQTRDIGFQPGDANAKMKVYEAPYYDICSKLYGRGDA